MDEQTANLILMCAPALSGAQLFALSTQHGSSTQFAGEIAQRGALITARPAGDQGQGAKRVY